MRVAQAALLGQSAEQPEGLVGDAILRVVEIDADRLGGQALAAGRIVGEEGAEVQLPIFSWCAWSAFHDVTRRYM